jgi:HAD superfamily hydrolase (TIGR01509 family)
MQTTVPAVIFDCDGVLIDSERIACRVDAAELAAHGIPVTADILASRFIGMMGRDTYPLLEAEYGVRLPADYIERIETLVRAACAAEGAALAMPGIHALLDGLAGRRLAVASSSSPDGLRRNLGQAGLWQRFAPHVYSAVEVARGKPAPDLFLHAAARLGAAPADCVVIEDSVPGVQAARAAGMLVLGFCGGGHCRPGHDRRLLAAGAAAVFDHMDELAAALSRGDAALDGGGTRHGGR